MSTHFCTAHGCGKPAITSFTSSMSGETYFECADHAPASAVAAYEAETAPRKGSFLTATGRSFRYAGNRRYVVVLNEAPAGRAGILKRSDSLDTARAARTLASVVVDTRTGEIVR